MHCYGIVPAYTLSTYVLGVRRDAPAAENKILIEPHLGDLKEASGTVVTEFGPVIVSWKKSTTDWQFEIDVPKNVVATLALPVPAGQDKIRLGNAQQLGTRQAGRLLFNLGSGKYQGAFPITPPQN